MLTKIINWAQNDPAVRAILLTGSRASKNQKVDTFSDYDLAFFITDLEKFTSDDSWFSKFGTVLIHIPETILFNNHVIPTRLIVYENGVGADISLWKVNILEKLVAEKKLTFACETGYQILLDKDGLAKQLVPAPGKRTMQPKPTQKEFLSAIQIFFFEAFNCAKYLARGDLWHAKLRDWTTKEYLLKMIEWNEAAKHQWNYDTYWHGKKMQSWVTKETWTKLYDTFGHLDVDDSWKTLLATMDLFSNLAKQSAKELGYQYPENIDTKVTDCIRKIRNARG